MVRQSDIKGAYTKVGDPSVKRNSGSSGRIFVIVGFLIVAILFVSMGRSASSAAQDGNLHSGQAHHSTTNTNPSSDATPHGGNGGDASHSSYDSYDTPPSSSAGWSPSKPESNPSAPYAFQAHSGEDSSPKGVSGYGPTTKIGSSGSASSSSKSGGSSKSGDDKTSGDDESGDDRTSGSEEDDHPSKSSSLGGKSGTTAKVGSVSGTTSSYDSGGSGPIASKGIVGGSGTSVSANGTTGVSGASVSGTVEEGDDSIPDASEADRAEQQVASELREAEETEVAKEEEKVQSTIGKLGSGLRIGLGRLFGDKASTEEIEDIAVAVETEVAAEVSNELETEATTVLNQELEDLQEEITAADEEGLSDHEIAEEIKYKRTEAIDEMKHSMEEIENRVEKSIATRTSLAEKKILEDKLSKKLGKTVKLTILEDEEEPFGGLDEAIETLPSLRGTDKKKNKKKKRTSLGDEADIGSTSRASQPKDQIGD